MVCLYCFFNPGAGWGGWSTPRSGHFSPGRIPVWGGWSTPRSGHFSPGRIPVIYCSGGWSGIRDGLDGCGKISPPPGFEPRSVHPIAIHVWHMKEFYWERVDVFSVKHLVHVVRLQLKCDGTRWRTGGEVKGKLANGVGSQYPSHYLGTWCIQHYYRWCAHLGCQ